MPTQNSFLSLLSFATLSLYMFLVYEYSLYSSARGLGIIIIITHTVVHVNLLQVPQVLKTDYRLVCQRPLKVCGWLGSRYGS